MYKIRQWSVTHSRGLEAFYRNFEPLLIRLHPLFKLIGYDRVEKPMRVLEKAIKGFLFDCQMRTQLYRNVLPDELPQVDPQWPLRWRASRRSL
jgi:hypothetical protein